MLSGLEAKGRAIADRARTATIARLAARVRAALPDIAVSEADDGLVLSARGLLKRLVHDAQLRWIGSLWR